MAKISIDGINYGAIITESDAYYYKGNVKVLLTKSSAVADTIDGGNGTDYIEAGAGDDTVQGGNGKDTLFGGIGNDKLYGDTDKKLDTTENGADTVYGGAGKDTIAGGNGADLLYGDEKNAGAGPQLIESATAADSVLCTYGDTMDGGNGGDRIIGGLGNDMLTGGQGPDVFVYDRIQDSRSTTGADCGTSALDWDAKTGDTILDFVKGQDKLDFTTLNGLNAALHFTGTTPTTSGIWYLQSGGATYIFADSNGDGKADIGIKVNGTVNFGPGDFVGLNDGPDAVDDSNATNEDTTMTVLAATGLLSNDTDPDSDPLTVTKFNVDGTDYNAGQIATIPGVGTLQINADGSYEFIPEGNYDGDVPVATYTISDGNGGTDTATLTLVITPVNDLPEGTDNTVTTNEDEAYVFTVADFGFSDVEPGSLFAVKITGLPTDGKLQLNGVDVVVDQEISATDIAADKLTFVPDANENGNDYATFEFKVGDSEGAFDDDANTITIDVTAVNDLPEGTDNTVITNEDEAYVFTVADFGFSDVEDGTAMTAVKITSLPGDGTLLFEGNPVSADDVIDAADIALGKLTFEPGENDNGDAYASFDFSVKDSDGAFDAADNTITIDVTAVNDLPEGTDNTVTTDEDTAYAFTLADFGFSDVEDTDLTAVKITSLPTDGALLLNGSAVIAGDEISATDITAGNLTFEPDANENGTGYATFDFSVKDADDGYDPVDNTITIDVTAVNDIPEGADKTVTTDEDTAYTFALADFGFSDVEDTDLTAVKIASLATDGKLQLNGIDVLLNAEITAADITGGNLKFVPDADENGDNYATFTFLVKDSGGAYDDDANTITVDVNAVDDGPPAGPPPSGGADPNDFDLLVGGAGSINGTGGDDGPSTGLKGTDDDDVINGFAGNDNIDGKKGDDTVYAGAGDDTINGNQDNDTLYGQAGSDGIDGNGGTDTLYGGSGNDNLTGETEADTIFGGSGNDTIVGNGGNDRITGGFGADTITGGGDADTFVFRDTQDTGDTILDFTQADGDKIEFNSSLGGNLGGLDFSDLQIDQDGTFTYVSINTDADPEVEFQVKLTGTINLTNSDFIFNA